MPEPLENSAFSLDERDELEGLIALRHPHVRPRIKSVISELHGLMTSVATGPLIMPSEWTPYIFPGDGKSGWESFAQAQRAFDLLFRFYNEVMAKLKAGAPCVLVTADDGGAASPLGLHWCRGYLMGIGLREDLWDIALEDEALGIAVTPIFAIANPEEFELDQLDGVLTPEELLSVLPEYAHNAFDWWQQHPHLRNAGSGFTLDSSPARRTAPKSNPNAPCACASGKKYKDCCSPTAQP